MSARWCANLDLASWQSPTPVRPGKRARVRSGWKFDIETSRGRGEKKCILEQRYAEVIVDNDRIRNPPAYKRHMMAPRRGVLCHCRG